MSKIVKVLICTGYGPNPLTPKMLEIANKYEGVRTRIGEIVKYVEKTAVPWEEFESLEAIGKAAKENHDLIVDAGEWQLDGLKGRNYYTYGDRLSNLSQFSIIEVDISRPWAIEEYDGSESIMYLDEKKLQDAELNYWK